MKKMILVAAMLFSISAQYAQAQIAPSGKAQPAQQADSGDRPPSLAEVKASYKKMCLDAAEMPAKFGGEADLKGHPKFQLYCDCFVDKFVPHAMKAAEKMSEEIERTNTMPKVSNEQAAQSRLEERAMRSSCRKSLNMPPLPATASGR